MQLDYLPETRFYTLQVPRVGSLLSPSEIMTEYGLDLDFRVSTPQTAVMFTPSPYAAATFSEHATPRARAKLKPILSEIELSRATDSGRHFDMPDGEELAGFQKADLEYGLARTRYLCADEPGLGKTPIAIAYANEIRAKHVLVVCPAHIRLQWCSRILRFSTMGSKYHVKNRRVVALVSSRYGVPERIAWTVVSYDLVRSPGVLEALRKQKFDLGIFDEIHYAKDIASKRSRALWGGGYDPLYKEALADSCERVVCLSGTPMPNRPREIYPVARHLNHGAFDWMSEERFFERFNPSQRIEVTRKDGTTAIVTDERSGRHAELQNRLRASIMSRHLKREVMTQLKLPVYDLIQVDETAAVKAALNAESLLDIDPETLEGATAEVLGHITTARRLMGEAIAPQCVEWIKMLIEGGENKLVLFYWFIPNGDIVMDRLMPWLVKRGKYAVRVDGSTSAKLKSDYVKRFVEDPDCAVILGNVLSLGTGVDDLQKVSAHALIMEPDWVPGNNVQCIDRLDRWGQTRTVQADIFVAPNSVAERVLASALRKGRVTHNALDRRAS